MITDTKKISFEKIGLVPMVLLFLMYSLPVEYLMDTKPFGGLRFWGLVDGFSHSFIGSIILFPLFREYNYKTYIMAFLSGGVLDFDHVAIVHSLDFEDIMLLVERPPTHSITFALVAGLVIALFVKNKAFIFWWVFIAITQHVVRDCLTDVTPILYPLPIYSMPLWLYVTCEIGLLLLAVYLGKRLVSPFKTA